MAEKEFQALLSGAQFGSKSSKGAVTKDAVVTNRKQSRTMKTETKTEKAMSFSSKLKRVRIN